MYQNVQRVVGQIQSLEVDNVTQCCETTSFTCVILTSIFII